MFYAHILRLIHWCLEVKVIFVKSEKVRIAARQNTVNRDLDQVNRTCGRAYIDGIIDAAASGSDACTIGIFLLRFYFKHNHRAETFLLSVTRYILK